MAIRTYADIETLRAAGELTPAEEQLLTACREGDVCFLGDGERPDLPANPDTPDPERTVRADLLRYLILGGCGDWQGHEWGVNLAGAWISGQLDLSFATAKGATGLIECRFERKIEALQACFQTLNLTGSAFPGLNAQGCEIAGDAFLRGCKTTGEVSFAGAKIGGQLGCTNAELKGGKGKALNAQGAGITGDAFLEGCKTTGEVSFAGATIGGQLDCEKAELNGGQGQALNAQGARITDAAFLTSCKTTGEVSFAGAKIGGQLGCENAELNGGEDEALNAQGSEVAGGAFLHGCKTTGEVSFAGAKIGGQLDCEKAVLNGGDGKALNAQGVEVAERTSLAGSKTTGEVSFSSARIGGQLSCTNAELNGGKGRALNAQRMTVTESFFWRSVKSVKGWVDLNSAHVGDLVDDAESWGKAEHLTLTGFTYDNLHGSLDLAARKAWLKKGAKDVEGDFHPQPYQQLGKVLRESGHRREAREILIAKEVEQKKAIRRGWTREQAFRKDLRLFSKSSTKENLEAVADSGTNVPGLWEVWIEKFQRRFGHKDYTKDRDRQLADFVQADFRNQLLWDNAKTRLRLFLHRTGDRGYRYVSAYGYKPWLSLVWMVLLISGLTWGTWKTWQAGDFAPNSDVILTSQDWIALAEDADIQNPARIWSAQSAPGQDYETFDPFFYAADVVIPIINIGQTDAWAPSTNRSWWGWGLYGLQKFAVVVGWVFTAIFAAAVTGMIRRDD